MAEKFPQDLIAVDPKGKCAYVLLRERDLYRVYRDPKGGGDNPAVHDETCAVLHGLIPENGSRLVWKKMNSPKRKKKMLDMAKSM